MVNETETRVIEVGENILDSKNVNDRNYRVYEVTGKGQFVATKRAYRDPDKIAEDRANGGDGTFEIVDFRLPVTQLYPELGAGEEREIVIDLTRDQADAVRNEQAPALGIRTSLGRFAKQFGNVDAPAPTSEDIQGEVILVAHYTTVGKNNGRTYYNTDVVAHLGDRLNYDLDRGKEIIEDEQRGSKRRV